MKRKTRIERVYNEDTGWFETREVEFNGSLKFEITAKRLYAASQRVL